MSKNPLVVLRVGYMESYDGPDEITGGGAYVEQRGVGGEVFNFKPSRGTCYGYAMSKSGGGIDLSKLDSNTDWNVGDELSGVDVVFIAKRPGVGQVVVGWYRNATVFHKTYRVRRGKIRGMDEGRRSFVCTADMADAHLLPEKERTLEVPSAPAGNIGFPGQSNVWYPTSQEDNQEVISFLRMLRRYIGSNKGVMKLGSDDEVEADGDGKARPKGAKGGRGRVPDSAHNAMVEAAAVAAVTKKYQQAGYTIESVEQDYVGWDLVARKGRERLHIEVKGCSGSSIYFELTPNEFAKLQEHTARYRVCVVCDALTSPLVYDFGPSRHPKTKAWRLRSAEHKTVVMLSERVAAVGTEIDFE
jgi:hypothetical protein